MKAKRRTQTTAAKAVAKVVASAVAVVTSPPKTTADNFNTRG